MDITRRLINIRRALVAICMISLVAACGDSGTGPSQGKTLPVVAVVPAVAPGEFDTSSYYLFCVTNTEGHSTQSDSCPVLRWNGLEYWALAYGDNRSSFAIHAFDSSGKVVAVHELKGARYLYSITIDTATKVITLTGQAAHTATLTFDELEAIK